MDWKLILSNVHNIFKKNGFSAGTLNLDHKMTISGPMLKVEVSACYFFFFYDHNKIQQLRIRFKEDNELFCMNFDEWTKEYINNTSKFRNCIKNSPMLDLGIFKHYHYRASRLVCDFLKKEYESYGLASNDHIKLMPISDNVSKADWHKKLLEDYTQYYQSDNKSDIVEKHYQEQARLHGLKFVVRQ